MFIEPDEFRFDEHIIQYINYYAYLYEHNIHINNYNAIILKNHIVRERVYIGDTRYRKRGSRRGFASQSFDHSHALLL